jgi:UDP-glucose 4-epimerase
LLATLLGQGAVNGRVAVTDPLLLWAGGDDFIDARDAAAANLAALDATALPSRVYTIGSGQLATFGDFVAAARKVRPELIFDDPALPDTGFAGFPYQRTQPFDVRCAQAELGFSARHDLLSSFDAASAWARP